MRSFVGRGSEPDLVAPGDGIAEQQAAPPGHSVARIRVRRISVLVWAVTALITVSCALLGALLE